MACRCHWRKQLNLRRKYKDGETVTGKTDEVSVISDSTVICDKRIAQTDSARGCPYDISQRLFIKTWER
jgi:hypothetical protein